MSGGSGKYAGLLPEALSVWSFVHFVERDGDPVVWGFVGPSGYFVAGGTVGWRYLDAFREDCLSSGYAGDFVEGLIGLIPEEYLSRGWVKEARA